tara:strand:+ start:396 stop:1115 length:720 start_codon:yes stop_codon:yes gene_type:complete
MKLTKRKAFNFFRSYFDVYNELESDSDKVSFMDALLNKQFLNEDPKDLKGISKFAYISQQHSIDKQVKGYFDKVEGLKNKPPKQDPIKDPSQGGKQDPIKDPSQQVQEKEKEKEKVEYIYNLYPSRCDTRKTSTGKTKKNKEQIKKLLKDHSKEHLESTIKKYIEESKQAKSYIKNFGTFLNNLPDYEEIEEIDNNKFDYYRFNDEYYGNIRRIEKGGKILKPHEILKIDKIGQRQKQW